MIELSQFCSKDESRPYICAPFSFGDFTYATNGHILVRVARRPECGEQDVLMEASLGKIIACHDGAEFEPLPAFIVPAEERTECTECDGSGKEHSDCKCCRHKCPECEGEGTVAARRSIAIGGVSFNVAYLQQIQKLPTVAFHKRPIVDQPAPFIFDGGIGVIMPLKFNLPVHLGNLKDFIA